MSDKTIRPKWCVRVEVCVCRHVSVIHILWECDTDVQQQPSHPVCCSVSNSFSKGMIIAG